MRDIFIAILDPVHSRFEHKEDAVLVSPCLLYDNSGWRESQYGNFKTERKANFIDMRNRRFLTGFLPRVEKFCERKGWKVKYTENNIIDYYDLPLEFTNPHLDGITFRPDQLQLINAAVDDQRGLLVAPTGSGKSIVMGGIMSCWSERKWLVLAHTTSLVQQLTCDFQAMGLEAKRLLSKGSFGEQITVSTRQLFSKLDANDYADYFDGVLIDELHQGASGGSYQKILCSMLAPLRFGFTATLPQDEYGRLLMEGLLGPLVGQLTIEEARELQILAEPKLKLISVPRSSKISALKTYKLIYKEGVVNNRTRNRLIMNEVKSLNEQGLTVIVFVQELEHMDNLLNMADVLNIPCDSVEGSTEQYERELIKTQLETKVIKCVISSTVWREGINIPSLGAVILASGLKSETSTLQSVGRGLRRTPDKDRAIIIDCLDPYKHLAEHTVQRLKTYNEQGWI